MESIFKKTDSFNKKKLSDYLEAIEGQITPDELFCLYSYAKELKENSTIVEIGSYKGKSTISLGLGAKLSSSRVYCIDPHDNFTGVAGAIFGPADLKHKIVNIYEYELGDVIFPICLQSIEVGKIWNKPINLLWIDGDHRYEVVKNDYLLFSKFVDKNGVIIFHDSYMDGVARVLTEIHLSGYDDVRKVDSMTIFIKK